MLQDLRSAYRSLVRRPAFSGVALLTLALGIAGTATIASVVRAVVFRPLPYPSADRLVLVWSKWTAFDKTWLSELELFDYQDESQALTAVGGWSETAVNLTGDAEPERVNAARVTAQVLPVLGTIPLHGRVFTDEEDRPGHDNVVILSHDLWQRRYAADPAIVGRTIQVNGTGRTVVGVMPRGFMMPLDFTAPEPTDVWMPLAIDRTEASRGSHYLFAIGRLKNGWKVEAAHADLATIAARKVAAGEYPAAMRFEALATGLEDEIIGPVRPALLLLVTAVTLLLLIACANVANLFLVQAEGRQRELAVRAAIGAGGRALARQMLGEGTVLALTGALLGVGLAWGAIQLMLAWPLPSIPRLSQVGLDWTVVAVIVAVTGATGVLVSLVPALHAARLDLSEGLRGGSPAAGTAPARQRFRHALVVTQIAMAMLLVTAAALVLRGLDALQHIDPGFRAGGVLTLRLSLPETSYPEASEVVAFYERLLDRVRRLPGVAHAGLARSLPLADVIGDFGLVIEGFEGDMAHRAKGDWQIASDEYFETMGERLVRGRWFTAADRTAAPLVAVVNQTMAETYWPGRDPVGTRFRVGRASGRPWVTVVGVVGDVRHNGITAAVKEKFYIPHSQWHLSNANPIRSMALTVRSTSEPLGLVGAIRREVRALDPTVPVSDVRTMEDILEATMAAPRFAGSVLASFALVALVVAAVGIHGVLSYAVSRRTREIGVRMALGAEPRVIRRMIVRQGIGWACAGTGLGLLLALGGARLLQSAIYGVSPTDPVLLAAVAALVVGVALAAALAPARRATRVGPLTCLRAE